MPPHGSFEPAAPPRGPRPEDDGDVFGPLARAAVLVLHAPRRHRALAAGVTAAGVVLGLVAAIVLPVKYEVRATILAQRAGLIGTLSNPGVNREWDAPTRAAREVVTSHDNLVALSRQTDFAARYLETRAPIVRARDWVKANVFRIRRTDARLQDDLVSALQDRLQVFVTPEGTVTIAFTWSDPDIAYQIVDAAVQSFLETRNASEIGGMGEAITILETHDAGVQRAIAGAIAQLDEKERALRIRTVVRRPAAPAAQAPVSDELVRLQGLLAAKQRALADVEDFRARRTSELQGELAQELATLAPAHPTVQSTRRALAALDAPSPQVAQLKAEIAQLQQDVAKHGGNPAAPAVAPALARDLAEARARVAEDLDPRLEYEREQLASLLRRHANLLDRIESARIELDTAQAAFQQRYRVIAPPKRPRGPLKPYRLLYFLVGAVLGVAGGLGAATLADVKAGRVVERWQVEESLDLPVLIEIRRR